MKKSLLALAAMGAFAGAAQAQSSVTVYGILDVGYIGSNAREAGNKVQKSAFGQSAETTSRLGFRGTEDLGGGTRAFFTVELGLTPQNPNLSGGAAGDALQRTTNGAGSAIDNRQSFVGLAQKGIGQFALGRQYTPAFVAAQQTSIGQFNNVIGDLVYAGGSSVFTNSSSGGTNGIGFTNRASNALTFQTDRFGGFVLSGMYAMNNEDTRQTANSGGKKDWNGWGVGGNFTWQKLLVTAAYQSFNTDYSNNVTVSAAGDLNFGGTGVTSAVKSGLGQAFAAGQTRDNQTVAGAVYDFGILKAYVQWGNRKVTYNSVEALNRNAQQIGVRGMATKTIEYWGSIGNGSVKTSAANGQSANFTGWQLGSNYILSKRTNLYAIYGQMQTSSTTSNPAGFGASQYAVGVRHTF